NLPPIRLNTDPQCNSYPYNNSIMSISSVLNKAAWDHHLQDYPDQKFVNSLLHIICCGANIGFTGDCTHPQCCKNLSLLFEHADVISTNITSQVINGCTAGPYASPPSENFHSSPLGAVTCKRSTKVRRIHHLSWPR
ncbi:hypothetical protein DFH05DRAFT_1379300, partial [Lentinula detonsa]